jgi:hypothetical protein
VDLVITQHVRLECDMPFCAEALFSGPLDFVPAAEVERALIATAIDRGWHRTPPGAGRKVRHYCPSHAPRPRHAETDSGAGPRVESTRLSPPSPETDPTPLA